MNALKRAIYFTIIAFIALSPIWGRFQKIDLLGWNLYSRKTDFCRFYIQESLNDPDLMERTLRTKGRLFRDEASVLSYPRTLCTEWGQEFTIVYQCSDNLDWEPKKTGSYVCKRR